jgi:hypothetical protein
MDEYKPLQDQQNNTLTSQKRKLPHPKKKGAEDIF